MSDERAVDGRRTDTRDRIRRTALEVFLDRGWEGATLREIAERLGVTRPALYYHFASKQAILDDIHRMLSGSVEALVQDAGPMPPTAATRQLVLERFADIMAGDWGPFLAFAQREEDAMRSLKNGADFVRQIDALAALLEPDDSVRGRMRARLALDAIFMADARATHLGGTSADRRGAALTEAKQLVQ